MKKNNKPASPAGGCKRYAQAITDYVLGEEIDVPKEELTAHLNECTQCREELTNWQDFQDMLRVKEYHNRPEVKEKWDRFIGELVSQPIQSSTHPDRIGTKLPPVIDTERIVGLAAGGIYDCLKKNGPIPLTRIRKNTGLEGYPFYEALGWLNREKKVIVRGRDEQPEYAELAPLEREKYQAQV